MTVGSLFSGIGGIDLGLEWAGHQTLWFCEVDPFCRRVLRKHWPDVPIYEDIRELRGADVVRPDLLCGGFPCQDVSEAGRRAGIEGERSGLWREMCRLVREIRPRYVLVENVPGLLRRGMGRVLGDLAAIGYDAEWQSLPAAACGAPHIRERVFLLAYPGCEQSERSREFILLGSAASEGAGQENQRQRVRDAVGHSRTAMANPQEQPIGTGLCPSLSERLGRGRSGDSGFAGASANTLRPRLEGDGIPGATRHGDWWATEPNVGRVAYGVPSRVDRLRALGNAVVPQCAEWIGRRLMEVSR